MTRPPSSVPSADRRALVLGGGGVTGIAWELGLIHGLAEAGVDLTAADLVIGTSAGSVVGALVRSEVPLATLYEHQLADASGEIAANFGLAVSLRYLLLMAAPGSDRRARARLGRAALRTKTVPEQERLDVIAGRLPIREWPDRPLLVTAVEAESGRPTVFDRTAGVPLGEAVTASCAVPLVWPPVTIRGRRYVDGGVRSPANADLAAGCGRVVVLAPLTATIRRSARIDRQLAELGAGVFSTVVSPDEAALKAIGRNVLDPARRAPAARAGLAQAAAVAGQVAAVWGSA